MLRSAAAVSGAAAATPLFVSLSESAVAAGGITKTTADHALVRGTPNAKGYAKIIQVAGEPHQVRADLGIAAAPGRASCRTPLLAFAQFSDVHVVDHQSPARVEWLDRFEDPNSLALVPGLLSASYRAHEMLTAQVMDAMVRALNDVGTGPITNLPLSFMIETGDNSDNCQKNEVRWNIDILDGKPGVRSDSGNYAQYEGVMDNNALYYDTHYWHPEGTPFLKAPDKLRDEHGFPTVPGLLAAARRPFDAQGLNIPWYTVFGNHDGLLQGNFPANTTQLDQLALGPVKVITVPPGVTQSDVLYAIQHMDIGSLLSSINLLGARIVTPDPARKHVSRKQIIEEHFSTTKSPVGHGYTAQNRADGTAYYYFDQGNFRFVVMDSVNPNGYADGSLDQAQFAWLKATIGAATGKAVLVFSHHTSATMSNPLVLTGLDPSVRVLGADVTSYLLSQARVIAWVNGHTHRNDIIAHARTDGSGGFWEINTASHIDFPQQARLIEVVDNADNTMSIFTTIMDHAGAVDYAGDLSNTVSLAGLSRELAANDPQSNIAAMTGTTAARNTELLLATPPDLRGRACATPASESSISFGAVAALAGAGVAAKVLSRREEAQSVDA